MYGIADGYRFTSIFACGILPDVRKCWKIWFRNDGDLPAFGYGGHLENISGAFVTESLTIIDDAPTATIKTNWNTKEKIHSIRLETNRLKEKCSLQEQKKCTKTQNERGKCDYFISILYYFEREIKLFIKLIAL